ncbi:carbonate dehydratase [Ahniella affigens]|uniref:Carbonic anhydrase n=1 Tax=Ahniella affigens TaxID=2021234 RepID=A0A2P1PLR9_9GAMM|nr:carbonate dehydratase [Ahniella affigens]AVP95780.1 carbonate dehydratase [Ahniella affigens]
MSKLDLLLNQNRSWADAVRQQDAQFFKKLSKQQTPKYLWIGCSDSRVPANQIVGLAPGEIFVHRNIANVVVHADLNCLSVLQFAVDVLRVEHVIVCGHYGCGGVQAALTGARLGLVDNWLRHVGDVLDKHRNRIEPIDTESLKHARLCELNVVEQALNVCQSTVVQDAWDRGQEVTVHSWIYSLLDGRIRDLNLNADNREFLRRNYEAALEEFRPAERNPFA